MFFILILSFSGAFAQQINKSIDGVNTSNYYITFTCNLELERLKGLFNPVSDSAYLYLFHPSQDTLIKKILYQNPLNPDWFKTSILLTASNQDKLKIMYWHSPNRFEEVERIYEITDSTPSYFSLYNCFNNLCLEDVFSDSVTVRFTVNMIRAKSAINGQPFPIINSVHIAGSELPLQWPSVDWPNSDSNKVIRLYDDGSHGDIYPNDSVHTIKIVFPIYTPKIIKYKYSANFGDSLNNGGGNNNEAHPDTVRTAYFDNRLYFTIIDTFGIIRDSAYIDPIIINSADTGESADPSVILYQNYPNPFSVRSPSGNPVTTIKFHIPHASTSSVQGSTFITLKVYDILGREVAVLVNKIKEAGTHSVIFDTRNTSLVTLPSGIYFYQLKVGNYILTKTMILLR